MFESIKYEMYTHKTMQWLLDMLKVKPKTLQLISGCWLLNAIVDTVRTVAFRGALQLSIRKIIKWKLRQREKSMRYKRNQIGTAMPRDLC
jgi:hypothetical protein